MLYVLKVRLASCAGDDDDDQEVLLLLEWVFLPILWHRCYRDDDMTIRLATVTASSMMTMVASKKKTRSISTSGK